MLISARGDDKADGFSWFLWDVIGFPVFKLTKLEPCEAPITHASVSVHAPFDFVFVFA